MTHYDALEALREFYRYKTGWFNGTGKSMNSDGLSWLITRYKHHIVYCPFVPYIYPVPDSRVFFEWDVRGYNVSIEFWLDSHMGYWDSTNTFTVGDLFAESCYLNLDSSIVWNWIVRQVTTKGIDDDWV